MRGLVLRHAATLAISGTAIGLMLSWPLGRAVRSLLFGVTGGDTFTWLLAPALLISVALLSGFGPARKAAKAEPAVTLRAD